MQGVKSVLLRSTLKQSAKGGLSRFMVESFVTPSLYPWMFSDRAWGQLVVDVLLKHGGEPRAMIEVLERNVRFRTTARRRYLQDSFKIPETAKTRLLDSDEAPTRAAVISGAFPEVMKFQYLGDEDAQRRKLVAAARQARTGQDLNGWTLEDVLESCGCYVHGTSAFNAFCELEGVYDLFTDEYVQGLADHLKGRRLVLEVGAGSGRLSHLLRKKLGSKTEVIATDSGSWSRMRGHRAKYSVVKCDYESALSVYEPDVILTSWMPMNQDWTSLFRKKKSCEEYILIGNPESCGKSWQTWGMRNAHAFDPTLTALNAPPSPDKWPIDIFEWLAGSRGGGVEPDLPSETAKDDMKSPFEVDGFEKSELSHLSRLQLCRYDRLTRSGNSKTVSFRRKK